MGKVSFGKMEKGREIMTRTEVKAKVDAIVIDQLGLPPGEPLEDGLRFVENLKADSLDSVEIAMKIEEEFGLEIPEDEIPKFQTIGMTIDYVFGKLAKKRG